MSGSTIGARVNRVIQQGYLAKWVVVGVLIGIIAGVGAVAFYLAIQTVSNLMLGGITGLYPPRILPGEEPPPSRRAQTTFSSLSLP